jgi:hypothetical protein
MMPPQTNIKPCLFVFAMLLGTFASSSAQARCGLFGGLFDCEMRSMAPDITRRLTRLTQKRRRQAN